MKRLLALLLAFSVNAFGASAIPNTFATQPSGNVPASYLDTNFALIANYNNYSNYLVDSGTTNTYVVTFPSGTTGTLAAGLYVNFLAGNSNTGASTLAVNGLTAKNITNYDASSLAAGQIKAGAIVSVIYDGTQYKLAGQPGGVTYGTATNFNNGTSSSSGGTVTATTLVGTLSTAAQPAITSVGTLTGLSVAVTSGSPTLSDNTGNGATLFSETAAPGAGNSYELDFRLNNTTPVQKTFANFFAKSSTTTAGAEVGTVQIQTMQGGTLSDAIKAIGGAVTIPGGSLYVAGSLGSNNSINVGTNLIISATAPTIASGFGTSPSILANNTAAFQITIGSGGTDNAGQLTMPSAPNGWACTATNVSSVIPEPYAVRESAYTKTTVNLFNTNTNTGSTTAFVAGNVIVVQCTAF